MDAFAFIMDGIYKILAFSSFGVIFLLIFAHLRQKNKAAKIAAEVTKKIEHGGGQAFVQQDNSIAIYIDNQLVDVIPQEALEDKVKVRTNDFIVSTQNIYKLIKSCIRYMVDRQNANQTLRDYWYYNTQIKAPLKKEVIYKKVMEEWQLKVEPYGLNYRVNKAEQREL